MYTDGQEILEQGHVGSVLVAMSQLWGFVLKAHYILVYSITPWPICFRTRMELSGGLLQMLRRWTKGRPVMKPSQGGQVATDANRVVSTPDVTG